MAYITIQLALDRSQKFLYNDIGLVQLSGFIGSQQGLDLIARTFLRAGDEVVVEALSYLGALQIFGTAGDARAVSFLTLT